MENLSEQELAGTAVVEGAATVAADTASRGDSAGFASAIASTLHFAATVVGAAVPLLSPWCFGAGEMWWFWPFALMIFAAAALTGAGRLVEALGGVRVRASLPARAVVTLVLCVPFLVYAAWRATKPSGPDSPLVWMEAERSLLLFSLPLLLALSFGVSSTPRSRANTLRLLLVDAVIACASAAYFHFATGDRQILWVATNDFFYAGRASAPLFCPNHFVDLAWSGVFIALATLLAPRARLWTRVLMVVVATWCLASGFLSASRGGLSAGALAMTCGVVLFGFRGRRPVMRFLLTVLAVAALVGLGFAARYTDNPMMGRVKEHALWKLWLETPLKVEAVRDEKFQKKFDKVFWRGFDRMRYISAALRAWRSNPEIGIGPGQHTHRWAQFEATDQGVRPDPANPDKTVKYPKFRDYSMHLYEVHSDWTQLLEEYGKIGMILFVLPLAFLLVALPLRQGAVQGLAASAIVRGAPLAVWLCLFSLSLHCCLDFSLQVPCLGWMLACLTCIALLSAEGEGDAARGRDPVENGEAPGGQIQ